MKSLVNDHELEQVGESLIRKYTETRAAPRCIDCLAPHCTDSTKKRPKVEYIKIQATN